VLVGVIVRVVYVAATQWHVPLGGDAEFYRGQAVLLVRGQTFIEPFSFAYTLGTRVEPSAAHPPLFTLVLALGYRLGINTVDASRLLCCVLGGMGVGMVGLLGREVAGRRVGLIAAGLAAAYPVWWVTDGLVLAEVLYVPLVAGLLLLAFRLWRRPSPMAAAGLGVAGGLAALTRSEGLLLLVLVAVPLVSCLRTQSLRRRAGLAAVVLGSAAVVVSPWVGYNLSRFELPVLMSTNEGGVLADSNCDATYHGTYLGWFVFACHPGHEIALKGDESERTRDMRDGALWYVRHHLGRVPVVVAARLGRTWGVYRPLQTITLDSYGRWGSGESLLMLISYYALAIGAVVGAVVLGRRGITLLPFIATLVSVALTVAVFYGLVRLRTPADVALVVLAAVGIDGLVKRVARDTLPIPQATMSTPAS